MLVQVIFKIIHLYCTFDSKDVLSQVSTSCFVVNTWCCSLSSANNVSKCHFVLYFFNLLCIFCVHFLGYSVVNPRLAEPLCKKKIKRPEILLQFLLEPCQGSLEMYLVCSDDLGFLRYFNFKITVF